MWVPGCAQSYALGEEKQKSFSSKNMLSECDVCDLITLSCDPLKQEQCETFLLIQGSVKIAGVNVHRSVQSLHVFVYLSFVAKLLIVK